MQLQRGLLSLTMHWGTSRWTRTYEHLYNSGYPRSILGCWGRSFRPTQDIIFWWASAVKTAPTTFQKTINVVLDKHTLCYLDDIFYWRSFTQHLTNLDETLGLLKTAGLKLNLEKYTTTINSPGFTISKGVSPDKGKVLAMSKSSTPS